MEADIKRIAVLSGKGGTGKTLITVNLAAVAKNSTYIDCDVEEPNGYLFFKPEQVVTEQVTVKIPFINHENCNGCRKCIDFCKFNALAFVNEKVILFDEICHSCGGCALLCPSKAIIEKDKIIGSIQSGISEKVDVITGFLNIGQASGVALIKKLLSVRANNKEYTFIDCPPGSACTVMESIKDSDYCIMVAEPTIFGVHNLAMVYELVKLFKKPYGVVLNKCLDENDPSEKFCIKNKIQILARIPYDSELGTLNANALIATRENKQYFDLFEKILDTVVKEVVYETVINP